MSFSLVVNLVRVPDCGSSTPVVDGTFVIHDRLSINGTFPVAHVPILWGFMRDDGAAFVPVPQNGNLSAALGGLPCAFILSDEDTIKSSLGDRTSVSPEQIIQSGLFPLPEGQNVTLNIFNVTARIMTDLLFRCFDQASVTSAVQHNVFPQIFVYQIDRTYQLPAFDPNKPLCDATPDAAHPNGDPSLPYFR